MTDKIQVLTKAEADKKIAKVETFLTEQEEEIVSFEIEDQVSLEVASEVLAEIKGLNNELEAQKKSATDPLTGVISTIRSWFKPKQDKLAFLEGILKKKIGDYHLLQAENRRKALSEASGAVRSGKDKKAVSQAMKKIEEAEVESVSGTSIRYTWDVEIEDQELLPDEWWTPDEGAITRFVRATNGAKPIPGCVYHKRPIVSQKAAK